MNDNAKKEFLKVNNFGFDFCFQPNEMSFDAHAEKIVEIYKQKCDLIVYNNKIIFSNLPKEIKVTEANFENSGHEIFDNKITNNCQNESTYLNFEIEKNATPKNIFVLYVMAGDVYQYSVFNIQENSTFCCFEKYVCVGEQKAKIVKHIEAKENSKINLTTLEELTSENAIFITNCFVNENANLKNSYVNLNNGKVLNYQNIFLKEKNAIATVKNAIFANKNNILPCLTQITHENKNTTSLIKNLAFVNDEAKVDVEGVNVILNGKTKSNARQETKIYNLSKNAKSTANPQLIIDEFDVKASHAAAVGNLDEQSIYYLMSRGLDKNKAKEMLVLGIINDILIDITNVEEQNNINDIIKNKIKE